METRDVFGGALPPGCRQADVDRGVSRLDDCSPGRLWRLLDEHGKCQLYRQFCHEEWAEVAGFLDDEPENPAESLRALWINWRNRAVVRIATDGRIWGAR